MGSKKENVRDKKKQETSSSPVYPAGKANKGMPITESKRFAFNDFKMQALLLVILGFILYANSFNNGYALDDGIVIQKNDYVQSGLRGIPKILSTDAYDSYYMQ